MRSVRVIKMIIKSDLKKGFKIKMIGLGLLENIINSYKYIIGLPFIVLTGIMMGICGIGEFLGNLFTSVLDLLGENLKEIKIVSAKDQKFLIDYFKKQQEKKYKVL